MHNTKSFTLRLPAELYEPIASMAQHERRSLHNQVLYLLDRAIESLEDAADIKDAEMRLRSEETIPFDQAIFEIEEQRRGQKA
jgi:hypothetical protein